MTEINWSLLKMPDIGGNAMKAFEEGRKIGNDMRLRKALRSYAENPDDREAYATIMQNNPEIAIKLSEHGDKRAFNQAMGDYLAPGNAPPRNAAPGNPAPGNAPPGYAAAPQGGMAPQGGTNALGGFAAPSGGPAPPPNALASLFAGQPALAQVPPAANPASQQSQAGPLPPAQTAPAGQPDLSILGPPQNGRDQAFLRMVQRDPIKALKIQSTLRDNFVSRAKAEHQFMDHAVEELSRVGDDASWQAALQRLEPDARSLGMNLADHVPGTYPGPDGVRELMERVLPIKDQLGYLLRQGNIETDNARADRNTDSLISERQARTGIAQGRLGETRRNNSQRDRTARRGQDMRPPPRAGRARPTATGPNGEKIEFDGKAWVPAK